MNLEGNTAHTAREPPRRSSWAVVAVAWTAVGLPLLWGVWATIRKALQLFG